MRFKLKTIPRCERPFRNFIREIFLCCETFFELRAACFLRNSQEKWNILKSFPPCARGLFLTESMRKPTDILKHFQRCARLEAMLRKMSASKVGKYVHINKPISASSQFSALCALGVIKRKLPISKVYFERNFWELNMHGYTILTGAILTKIAILTRGN